MKKLIVLVAVAVFGLSSYSATLDWKMTVAVKGYQTMFFSYSDLSSVQAILDAGGDSTLTSLEALALQNNGGKKEFATSSKSATLDGQNFAGIAKGTDVFAVVFDTKSTSAIKTDMTYGMSGKFSTASSIYDGNAEPPEASPGTFAFDLTSGLTTGTIGGGEVPEPTSGILMLVGLGALALRRRRA